MGELAKTSPAPAILATRREAIEAELAVRKLLRKQATRQSRGPSRLRRASIKVLRSRQRQCTQEVLDQAKARSRHRSVMIGMSALTKKWMIMMKRTTTTRTNLIWRLALLMWRGKNRRR